MREGAGFTQGEWMHGHAPMVFAVWIALCIGFACGAAWSARRRDDDDAEG